MKRNLSLLAGAVALLLALSVLAGCSGKTNNVAEAPGKEPAANHGNTNGTDPAVPGSSDTGNGGGSVNENDTGNGGNVPAPSDQPGNDGGKGANAGTNSGTETDDGGPKIVAGNEAFRVYSPAPDSVVGKSFKVKGQARVFEAAFSYTFEDGHNVLAEGHAMADKGAPEWGGFELAITLSEMPSSPTGVLTIYESSAKDGTPVHELHIAYKFEKGILKLEGE